MELNESKTKQILESYSKLLNDDKLKEVINKTNTIKKLIRLCQYFSKDWEFTNFENQILYKQIEKLTSKLNETIERCPAGESDWDQFGLNCDKHCEKINDSAKCWELWSKINL